MYYEKYFLKTAFLIKHSLFWLKTDLILIVFQGISHSVVCRKTALHHIESCIPFVCFHIQCISPTYCGKRFPTTWESIP